jgi:hypothetical protein
MAAGSFQRGAKAAKVAKKRYGLNFARLCALAALRELFWFFQTFFLSGDARRRPHRKERQFCS